MGLSKKTKEYWREEDLQDLEKAELVADLYIIAKRVINRMPKPFVQICGPITTGGLGSIEANVQNLNDKITQLQNEGLDIFDQMPFESPMKKMREKFSATEYFNSILIDFYLPIFESGLVSRLYFIQGWESSTGAKWEHEKAKALGIEIIYLK